MIALLLAMLRVRRGQAVTLALLALFAVAATVAAPAYLAALDRAVVTDEIGLASVDQRELSLSGVVNEREPGGFSFADFSSALVTLPGFTETYASEFPALGIDPDPAHAARVTYRQDTCRHLVIVSGRCMVGAGEVLLGERTARQFHLGAGDPFTLTFATLSSNPRTPWYEPNGTPNPVTVVGTYRVRDPGDPYWGSHGYFSIDATGQNAEPVFTDAATMMSMDRGATYVSVDALAGTATLAPDRFPAVRGELDDLRNRSSGPGVALTISTNLPQLLDRIDRSRALARDTVPVAAVPLVLLSYVVLFLAAGYGAEGRRPELTVVALRGARWWTRWWLATGESLVAVVLGALVGCVTGQLLVDAVVRARFPGIATPWFTATALRYAPLAALGAVAAVLLGQRRYLTASVADLMRRVRVRGAGWRLPAVEAVIALLAVVTTAQLWVSQGTLTGVGLTAPALVTITLAVLVARVAQPVARGAARWSLRRGRLAGALAAFPLARRPAAQRLLLLLVASIGVFGYSVCAVDVSAHDRDVIAGIGTGADRVLSVATPITPDQLLHAVRTADPDGRWAMAAAAVPGGAPGELPRLAVDSTRLAAVVNWRDEYGAPSAAQVAAGLRPTAPAPVVVPGQDVTLDVTVHGVTVDNPLNLAIVLSSVAGHGTATLPLGALDNGTATVQQRTPACVDGCRLVGIHLTANSGTGQLGFDLTVRGLGSLNPVQPAVTGMRLRDASQWRAVGGDLTSVPDGLRLSVEAPGGLPDGVWIQPVDAPLPLPVASTAALAPGATLAGLDGRRTPVTGIARLAALPRLGSRGALVDLEYANRVAADAGAARQPEVWLGSAAPPDALTLLARQNLAFIGDTDVGSARRHLDVQGPALAVWFHLLTGVLAILLALGGLALIGAVDGRTRTADLATLRLQGLPARTVRRAMRWAYPVLVLVAGVFGLAVALITWRLTGWALPISDGNDTALPLPPWPHPLVLLLTWLAAVTVLTAAALAVGSARHRTRSRAPNEG